MPDMSGRVREASRRTRLRAYPAFSCGLVKVSTGSAIYNLMPGLVLTVTRTKLKCRTNGSSYGCLISSHAPAGSGEQNSGNILSK